MGQSKHAGEINELPKNKYIKTGISARSGDCELQQKDIVFNSKGNM